MYDKPFLPNLSSFLTIVPKVAGHKHREARDERLLQETLHAHHTRSRRDELWEESRQIISEAIRRMTFVRFASANIASALRTLCIPDLVEGVNHTKKILANNPVVSRSTHDLQARLFLVSALNELVLEKRTSFKLPEADRLMRIISKRLYRR